MDDQTNICPICHQPKDSKASGRLTQWIVSCKCGAKPVDVKVDSLVTLELCAICKKRIQHGRAGSFTQWIFRADICDCEKPEPILTESKVLDSTVPIPALDVADNSEPLPLEPDKFPVNRYKPLKEIGDGMAGTIYLCRDLVLNKLVAVKTLRSLTSEQLVAFQQEAKALSKLSHPGIVQVLDFGATESGDPFMVMEFIEGTNLARMLSDNGALRPDSVIDIMRVLCSALTVAHENGIFHRDLKPSNILIRELKNNTLDAKLVDFGLARVTASGQEVTLFQGRSLLGSPSYMSPELITGAEYDERCEIYSLGCMMFELLTGSCPFSSDTALHTLYLHVNEAPPKLSDIVGEPVSERLEMVVAHCMEKDPGKRFQTVAELQNAFAPEAVLPPATGTINKKTKSKYASIQWGAAIFASLAVFAALANLVLRSHTPEPVPQESKVKARAKSKVAKKIKAEAEQSSESLAHALTGFSSIGPNDETYFGGKGSERDIQDAIRSKRWYKNFVFQKAGLTDKVIADVVKLKPWTITMDDCVALTDKSLVEIGSLPRLDRLIMDEAKQITPKGLKALSKCANLEFISLRNCNFNDEHMKVLSSFPPALHKLNVSNNPQITSAGIAYFKNRPGTMDIIVENTGVLIPAITIAELKQKYHLSVTLEDKDTFDFGIFSEAMDEGKSEIP